MQISNINVKKIHYHGFIMFINNTCRNLHILLQIRKIRIILCMTYQKLKALNYNTLKLP